VLLQFVSAACPSGSDGVELLFYVLVLWACLMVVLVLFNVARGALNVVLVMFRVAISIVSIPKTAACLFVVGFFAVALPEQAPPTTSRWACTAKVYFVKAKGIVQSFPVLLGAVIGNA
jgi:hypothetical protein